MAAILRLLVRTYERCMTSNYDNLCLFKLWTTKPDGKEVATYPVSYRGRPRGVWGAARDGLYVLWSNDGRPMCTDETGRYFSYYEEWFPDYSIEPVLCLPNRIRAMTVLLLERRLL